MTTYWRFDAGWPSHTKPRGQRRNCAEVTFTDSDSLSSARNFAGRHAICGVLGVGLTVGACVQSRDGRRLVFLGRDMHLRSEATARLTSDDKPESREKLHGASGERSQAAFSADC